MNLIPFWMHLCVVILIIMALSTAIWVFSYLKYKARQRAFVREFERLEKEGGVKNVN